MKKYPQVDKYFVRLDAVHNISKQYQGKDANFTLWEGRDAILYGNLADCVREYGKRAGIDLKDLRAMWVKYFKRWQK